MQYHIDISLNNAQFHTYILMFKNLIRLLNPVVGVTKQPAGCLQLS